jgi:N-acetylglucosamine kinase-like BadF-type ATPase
MKRIFKFLFGTNPNSLYIKSTKALSAFNETLETLKNINESATREVSKKATEIAEIEADIALLASIKTNNQKIIANIEKILN